MGLIKTASPLLERTYEDLLELAMNIDSKATGDAFLRRLLDTYGFETIAYAAFNLPLPDKNGPIYQNTYCDPWRTHYHQNGFIFIDPVIHVALAGLLPADWRDLRREAGGRVLNEAIDFGVGEQGLTLPIRGVLGETAAFSISVRQSNATWRKMKKQYIRDLQSLANFFHVSVINRLGLDKQSINQLSEREMECLKWAALGKSAFETGMILSISERTVAFHLTSARYKLHCLTTTQAVARALTTRQLSL
jgi:DNA-binding CsgD family transcriptional regulator